MLLLVECNLEQWICLAVIVVADCALTLVDNSRNQLADMMVKGTSMGINELTAMRNEKQNLDEGVLNLLEKLLALEENYEKRLRKFL